MSRYAAVNVRFGADISQFSTAMQNAARQMQRAGDQLQNVGKSMSMNLTAPILALGTASLYAFGKIDMLKRGLTTFMGTTEAAEAEFSKLREVAKLPGIGLEEAVRGANNLMAIGMSADEARKAMMSFGNAIATVGGGREMFDLAIRGFGQLSNAAKPLQQDLYQIANQLPQVNKLMKEAFGTNRAEDLAAMGITGKQLADFLVTELGKLPPVTGGIANAFENMADTSKIALATFGEAIDKNFNISGRLTQFAEWVSGLADKFKNLSPEIQKASLVFAGIVAAIGPLLLLLGAIVKIFPTLLAGFAALKTAIAILTGPMGILALGLAALGVVVYQLATKTDALQDSQVDFAKATTMATVAIDKEQSRLKELYKQLSDTNLKQSDRVGLIKEFNQISGANIKNIDDETKFQNALAEAYKKTNEQMQAKKFNALEAARLQRETDLIALQSEIETAKAKADQYKKENIVKIGPIEFTTTPISDLFGTPLDDLDALNQKAESLRLTIQALSREMYKISPSGEVAKIDTTVKTTTGGNKTDPKAIEVTPQLRFSYKKEHEEFLYELEQQGEQEVKVIERSNAMVGKAVESKSTVYSRWITNTTAQMRKAVEQLGAEFSNIIQGSLAGMINDSFAMIGENIAMKQDPFENIGKNLKDSMGKLLATLGSAMISWGIAQMAFNVALGTLNPVGMIAAGAAMVAIGAGVSRAAQGGLKGAATSSGGNAGSYSGGSETLTLQTRLDGNDLYLSGQRTQLVRGR